MFVWASGGEEALIRSVLDCKQQLVRMNILRHVVLVSRLLDILLLDLSLSKLLVFLHLNGLNLVEPWHLVIAALFFGQLKLSLVLQIDRVQALLHFLHVEASLPNFVEVSDVVAGSRWDRVQVSHLLATRNWNEWFLLLSKITQ